MIWRGANDKGEPAPLGSRSLTPSSPDGTWTVVEPNVADGDRSHLRQAIARIGVRMAASCRLLPRDGDAEALLGVYEVVVVGAGVELDLVDLAGDGPPQSPKAGDDTGWRESHRRCR